MTKADIQALVQRLRSASGSRCYPAAAAALLLTEAAAALSRTPGEAGQVKDEVLEMALATLDMIGRTEPSVIRDYARAQADAFRGVLAKEALCKDEGCPHHGTEHVCVTSTPGEAVAWACAADIEDLTDEGKDVSLSKTAMPQYGMRMPLYAHPAPAAPAGEIEAVKAAIRRACADEVNGRPNGDIIVKGCEAAEYVNPEDAAASFVDSIAEEVCAALATAERDATERAAKILEARASGYRARAAEPGLIQEMVEQRTYGAEVCEHAAAAIRSGEKA